LILRPARHFVYAKIFGMYIPTLNVNVFFTDNKNIHKPAIVFIHGFPFDHTLWQEQATLLDPSHRVITYDQRGHGQTGTGGGNGYFFEQLVDDLESLLDHLGIPKAILCGLSMGGYVALRAIERHPERVRGLILCDTRSEPDSDEAKLKRAVAVRAVREKGVPAFVEGFLKTLFTTSRLADKSPAVERVRRIMLGNTPEGICNTLLALATRTDTTPALAGIRVPTLILVGEQDAITPPSAARAMQERIPRSVLMVVPDSGHISNIDNPAIFNQELSRFLTVL
jgi:3-oxoadipate enol-lactonase